MIGLIYLLSSFRNPHKVFLKKLGMRCKGFEQKRKIDKQLMDNPRPVFKNKVTHNNGR